MLGKVDAVGRRQLLDARGQSYRVSLRGVVHAQVVADLAYHHLTRIEAHAHGEVQSPLQAQLVGVSAQLFTQMQRRVAGSLGVILVCDRRAEQRHDPIARVLVDGALEAVHAVGENLEEAIEDLVPLFRIDLLGKLQ